MSYMEYKKNITISDQSDLKINYLLASFLLGSFSIINLRKYDIFQLKKVYKSGETEYQRMINKPVLDSVEIYLNNTQIYENFTIDYQFGKVKFNSAVPVGVQIFASFEFDVPKFGCWSQVCPFLQRV